MYLFFNVTLKVDSSWELPLALFPKCLNYFPSDTVRKTQVVLKYERIIVLGSETLFLLCADPVQLRS